MLGGARVAGRAAGELIGRPLRRLMGSDPCRDQTPGGRTRCQAQCSGVASAAARDRRRGLPDAAAAAAVQDDVGWPSGRLDREVKMLGTRLRVVIVLAAALGCLGAWASPAEAAT